MRNYSLGIGASQIYSVISQPYSCFVVLILLICREVAGYYWTLWESSFWDFPIMHPLIHAIQHVKFISVPLNQYFLRKVPRAISLARAKNIGSDMFRSLLRPEDFAGICIHLCRHTHVIPKSIFQMSQYVLLYSSKYSRPVYLDAIQPIAVRHISTQSSAV